MNFSGIMDSPNELVNPANETNNNDLEDSLDCPSDCYYRSPTSDSSSNADDYSRVNLSDADGETWNEIQLKGESCNESTQTAPTFEDLVVTRPSDTNTESVLPNPTYGGVESSLSTNENLLSG